ncbi:MAG: NUMOD3 domain-containing DNA-binding protein, partial [Nanoarchaeota archaeon]
PVSNENKKRHSEFIKSYYKTHKHPMLGKKQSEESIKKATESRRITLSNNPEIRKKFGRNFIGKTPWNKGKLMSKEIREKMHRIIIEDMQEIAKIREGKCSSKEYNGSGNNLSGDVKEGIYGKLYLAV